MKYSLFLLFCFSILSSLAKNDNNVTLYLKDNTTVSGHTETKSEKNMLYLKKIIIGEKAYAVDLIDSLLVNRDAYSIIRYKDSLYVARTLFKGEVETYKIFINTPVYLIRKPGEDKFKEVTSANKFGIYNYYFKQCLTKDSTVVRKRTNGLNDYILTNDIVKKLNCNKTGYTVYKKYEKSGFYLFIQGGVSIWKPVISSGDGNFLSNGSKKAKPGYFVGGGFLGNINKRFDVLLAISYANNTATFHDEETNTFPISYKSLYNGTFKFKALNGDINFRYRFLKYKISPFVLAGIRFSYKTQTLLEYTYTNEFSNASTNNSETLYSAVIGLNIGAGCNYDIIKRLSVFINATYTYGFGLYGPPRYSTKESDFNAGAGIMIRLNK